MKHCFMFLLGIFLSATLCGQNYSSEVVFLQQQGNTLTVRALGISEKKKEAANMALKSAFYTLFYTGVDGVNKGNPMVSTAKLNRPFASQLGIVLLSDENEDGCEYRSSG